MKIELNYDEYAIIMDALGRLRGEHVNSARGAETFEMMNRYQAKANAVSSLMLRFEIRLSMKGGQE